MSLLYSVAFSIREGLLYYNSDPSSPYSISSIASISCSPNPGSAIESLSKHLQAGLRPLDPETLGPNPFFPLKAAPGGLPPFEEMHEAGEAGSPGDAEAGLQSSSLVFFLFFQTRSVGSRN